MAVVSIDADVLVAEAAPVAAATEPAGPTPGAVKRVVARLLQGRDLATLSLKTLRKEVEERLAVPEGCLAARKDEVKAAAHAFMEQKKNESEAATAAPVGQVPSLAASGRVVPNACEPVGGTKRPAEDGQLEAKVKKVPKVSGNSLFRKEIWASVTEGLIAENGGVKPTLGACMGAVAARWKTLPKEEVDKYDEQAQQANALVEANGGPAPAKKQQGPKKDKAKPKGKEGEPELTRAEFQKFGQAIKATICSSEQDCTLGPEIERAVLQPRVFKTGTVGWFFCKKIAVPMGGGRSVNCQAQFSFMVNNSKNWEDGEGYHPGANLSTEASTTGDGAKDAENAGAATTAPAPGPSAEEADDAAAQSSVTAVAERAEADAEQTSVPEVAPASATMPVAEVAASAPTPCAEVAAEVAPESTSISGQTEAPSDVPMQNMAAEVTADVPMQEVATREAEAPSDLPMQDTAIEEASPHVPDATVASAAAVTPAVEEGDATEGQDMD